jgi:hypothetical protein
MAKRASIYASVVLVVLAVLFAGGYRLVRHRSEMECGICQRHIMPQTRVVAEIGGRRRTVCCAHCAITEALQEHKPLRLIEVTDYPTGTTLNPQQAWYVERSRVVACEHSMTKVDEMKQAAQLSFDRCSPGTFAFRQRQAAEEFVTENGGVVRDLSDLLREVRSK